MTSGRKPADGVLLVPASVAEDDVVSVSEEELGADLVEDAYDYASETTSSLVKKRFSPWHLPRKHYVRIHQWCVEIRALAKHLKKRGTLNFRPLSYLSLPGDELLDVRTIHGVCDSQDVGLYYLGFNAVGSGERALESHLSENEVKALPRVNAQRSMVLNEELERISNKKSLAYRRVKESGSFDVVNLDLCGSVASQPPMTVGGTLDAIRALLDIQRTCRAEPWLLFLTTRVGTDVLDGHVVERLRMLVRRNVESSDSFRQALEECLQMSVSDVLLVGDGDLSHSVFARIFGVGFGKWLLGLVLRPSPRWRVVMTSVFGYRVDRESTDMLSLGFRFELIEEPTLDSVGLTGDLQAEPGGESEENLATKMALMIKDIVDVDALLEGDSAKREKITKQSADILAQARYGAGEYFEWLGDERVRRGQVF